MILNPLFTELDILIAWVSVNGWIVLLAQYFFSAAVQSLPEPNGWSGKFYVWLFRFSHLIAGNMKVVTKPLKGKI